MRLVGLILFASSVVTLIACETTEGETTPDDAVVDAVTDAEPDAGADAGEDAADAAEDVDPRDAAEEVAADVSVPDGTTPDAEPGDAGADGLGDVGPGGPEGLCAATGGTWDAGSCGHWRCGEPPSCEALIPGCNCGSGEVFDPEVGCVASDECAAPTEDATACVVTGGLWDPTTCGHWVCGNPPACDAVIPGCNCGKGRQFVAGEGCAVDEACQAAPPEQGLCVATGGTWVTLSCGHWQCGNPPVCAAVIPGCNCGEGQTFAPGEGCKAGDC